MRCRLLILLTVLAAAAAPGCSGDDDGPDPATPAVDGSQDSGGEVVDGAFDLYTLTIGVTGEGVVASSPEGIRCGDPGGACTHDFLAGQTVTLTAEVPEGQMFGAWSGDCAGADACTLVMDEPRYAAAGFVPVVPQAKCPAPAAGKVSVCGKVYDLADTQLVGGVRVLFFDADAFLAQTGAPLASITAAASGEFIAVDVPAAPSGKYVAATDDPAGSDNRALTAVVVAAPPGGKTEGVVAFSLRRATDAAWTSGAGNPFNGPVTFSVRGVFVGIFIDRTKPAVGPFAGTPASGVTLLGTGDTWPAYDFYFTDTDPLSRASATVGSATGLDGTGLFFDSPVTGHSGTGGLPAGCAWLSHLGASVPDAVVVQVFESSCP